MQNIHERYTQLKARHPEHVFCKNYETYKVPLRLESIANRMFENVFDDKLTNLWNNYVKADSELTSDQFNFYVDREEMVTAIEERIFGKYFLSADQLADVITLQVKKNAVSYMVDFSPYVNLLEHAYNFQLYDFYKDHANKTNTIRYKLNWSVEDYAHYSKLAPTVCYNAAKIRLLDSAYDDYCDSNNVNPVNIWHTLLDYDFEFVNSGSIATIDNEPSGDVEFDLFKRIVFKELEQIVGNAPVTFFVEW